MESNLNEQEINRRNAVIQMRDLGIEPYPAEMYEVNAKAAEILQNYDGQKQNYQNVSVAGRIMSRRIMGAAAFIELMDESGRIQVYVKRDEICPGEDKTLYNTVFKKLMVDMYGFMEKMRTPLEEYLDILSSLTLAKPSLVIYLQKVNHQEMYVKSQTISI